MLLVKVLPSHGVAADKGACQQPCTQSSQFLLGILLPTILDLLADCQLTSILGSMRLGATWQPTPALGRCLPRLAGSMLVM
jgi:hypothetical protein